MACFNDGYTYKMFIWRGEYSECSEEEAIQYVSDIKHINFTCKEVEKLEVIEEIPNAESDEFFSLL